jgi:hypothetical protein
MLELYVYPISKTTWVFDDPRTNLKEESFVCGISEMITEIVNAKGIDGSHGITLQFAEHAFEGHDVLLHWDNGGVPEYLREQITPDWAQGGNWYTASVNGKEMRGWLCPALGLYFLEMPKTIAVRVSPLPHGVNPIWTPPPGQLVRQFVRVEK